MTRCSYTGKVYVAQTPSVVQCKHDEGHEGWHQLEVKNEQGTYKATEVYLRRNDAVR